jgi:hypothetical protein
VITEWQAFTMRPGLQLSASHHSAAHHPTPCTSCSSCSPPRTVSAASCSVGSTLTFRLGISCGHNFSSELSARLSVEAKHAAHPQCKLRLLLLEVEAAKLRSTRLQGERQGVVPLHRAQRLAREEGTYT